MSKSIPISVLIGSLIISGAILYSGHPAGETNGVPAPPTMRQVCKQFTAQFASVYGYDGWETPDGKVSEIASVDFQSGKFSADLKMLELCFTYKLKNGHSWDCTTTLQGDAFYNYTGKVAGRVIAIR